MGRIDLSRSLGGDAVETRMKRVGVSHGPGSQAKEVSKASRAKGGRTKCCKTGEKRRGNKITK